MNEIKTMKDRTCWIYVHYQDAVNFDQCLLAIYENYFGKLKQNQVSTVKRCGRYWRANCTFQRNRVVVKQNKKYQQKILNEFT